MYFLHDRTRRVSICIEACSRKGDLAANNVSDRIVDGIVERVLFYLENKFFFSRNSDVLSSDDRNIFARLVILVRGLSTYRKMLRSRLRNARKSSRFAGDFTARTWEKVWKAIYERGETLAVRKCELRNGRK